MSNLIEWKYNRHDLITDNSKLDEQQKDMIAFAISNSWVMPKFKARHFVGQAQITPYAEYKQYMMELSTREDACERFEYEVQKLKLEQQLEKEKQTKTDSEAQKLLHQLEIDRIERNIKRQENLVTAAYEERQIFIDLLIEFINSPRNLLPDGRSIDDIYKNHRDQLEELERHHWTMRLAKQTAMDMIAFGRAGVGNIDAVMMLDGDQQRDVMQLACDLFVRNEHRTQNMLTTANERYEQGQLAGPLAQMLDFNTTESKEDVYLIQSGK